MNNLDRNTLVENFTSNTDMNLEISNDHRSVMDYLVRGKENIYNLQDIVKYITTVFFSEELNWESLEEIKYSLEECNLYEYVDDLVDIYNEDLIKSYFYFDTDIQLDDYWISDEDDDIIIKVLKQAQFEWYLSLFSELQQRFITYLEWLES